MMKKSVLFFFAILFFSTTGYTRDFIIDFMDENYKETQADFSYTPVIYHSIQVNSIAGPKLLILTGDDYIYRKWLRQYIAQDKKFIAVIPDDRIDDFISAKAYSIDVTDLHPFNGEKWAADVFKSVTQNSTKGDHQILIVDPNEKRTHLLQLVAKKMGYHATIFNTGKNALDAFKLQPDKFKMVIVQHSIAGKSSDELVAQILKLNHTIPIIIDTGYGNEKIKNDVVSKFSNHRSVHIKPVILRDLLKTIKTLVKENA